MDEFLVSMGWYKSGACGCSPQKYTWKNDSIADTKIKVCPARNNWELIEYDHVIMRGQSHSLQSQYNAKYTTT